MSSSQNKRLLCSNFPGKHFSPEILTKLFVSARLLIIDYGLSEKTVQSICYGLDQLTSIMNKSVSIRRIPMLGILVNGQSHSEVRCSLTSNIISFSSYSLVFSLEDFPTTLIHTSELN